MPNISKPLIAVAALFMLALGGAAYALGEDVPEESVQQVTPQTDQADASMEFISLGRVTFAVDKWDLSDDTKRTLDDAAAYLSAHPGTTRILIRGHADWTGSSRHNDTLSDKRAAAVRDYLAGKGLTATLVHGEGHGEHAPIDENWTRLGRVRNRQVELYAVYLPSM